MQNRSKIIFLHGASSSGKSTLAKKLQAEISEPFWHISIDHLRDSGVLPISRFKSGEFNWCDHRANFFDGYHQSLFVYAKAGNNLIIEHILDTQGWLELLVKQFRQFDVYFVGVHCPLNTLELREKQRGDRPVGSARRDFETIHDGLQYDFEIDGSDPVDENVRSLLKNWANRSKISQFNLLNNEFSK